MDCYFERTYRQMEVNGVDSPETSAKAVLTVAVAVKRYEGRGSQRAFRWALENLMTKAHRFILLHVMPTITSIPTPSGDSIPVNKLDANLLDIYVQDMRTKCEEMLRPFSNLSKKRNIETVVIEGDNPALALLEYISDSRIRSLVLGSSSSSLLTRKVKVSQVPSVILKHAPETCGVYVISPRKLITNSLNSLLPSDSSSKELLNSHQQSRLSSLSNESEVPHNYGSSPTSDIRHSDSEAFHHQYSYEDGNTPWTTSHNSGDDVSDLHTEGHSSDINSAIAQLRLEFQRTLALYNEVCEDLVHAQTKAHLLSSEYLEEARKVDSAKKREESFRQLAAEERVKHLEAEKEVEMARKLLAKEAYARQMAELNALRESIEKHKMVDELLTRDGRYRKYTKDEIELATEFFSEARMIGEGGYGTIYRCNLDHTPVAVKVLHSDGSDKKEEFLKEVEVLSQLQHPHIVLLIGACPDNRSLIYEYMENGNLDDHIFHRNGKAPLPWFSRLRIIVEVACGLAYLHNLKPQPIIHRDLKPGNILLDKNLVSKIGDVGLAKIISEAVPDNVTEYQNSVLAGTLPYMDPEYLRTGTIRPKSDLFAFGVIILQLLSARGPNGLILMFEDALKNNRLIDVLDKTVVDWPSAETKELAQVALRCSNLRCRDRPDLETEVMPVLRRLADIADVSAKTSRNRLDAPSHFYCPILLEIMDDPHIASDGFTYEHVAIRTWLDRHDISPVTNQKFQHKMLIPNNNLHSAIQQWRLNVTPSIS